MSETDFEDRLRGHLAAKARLIEVPDHKFVQTRIVPFQPRRRRFSTLVAAAAAVAVVAILGFGVFQTTVGGPDQAGIIPTTFARCEIIIVPGSEGYWLRANTSVASIGPVETTPDQKLTIEGDLPVTVQIFDSPSATTPMAETTIDSADGNCSFGVSVSNGPTGFQLDVTQR
ncbi:MAG: hypothetical protein JJE47_14330 [Acidimicrobiia bacterium]|nr:hypothetical protein [Acidimicrobiia bacterium]